MRETLAQRTLWELMGLEHASRIRDSIPEDHLRAMLLTLLVDHSGSMRGERMLLAAAAVDVARSFLVHLGVSVEVLGFTTRSWKGGWSRRLWRLSGSRRKPGRLCDLLHIVYADATDPLPGSSTRSMLHMLDPDLLKENVDGEAILWASSRQDIHTHAKKAIVVISDGAPVDDSTLFENDPNFLMDHLAAVVSHLSGEKVMAQLQIGREAHSPFPIQAEVNTLTEIGTTLLDLLERVLAAAFENEAVPHMPRNGNVRS